MSYVWPIVLITGGVCLLAAFAGPYGRQHPMTLFLGIALALFGAEPLSPPVARQVLSPLAWASLVMTGVAYASEVRSHLRSLKEGREQRLQVLQEELQRIARGETDSLPAAPPVPPPAPDERPEDS